MSISSYQDLEVWQVSMDIVEQVYKLTQNFPRQEMYGLGYGTGSVLSSQIQRAAVSIPSNIAEGHARNSTKEFFHFLSVALGSIAELETQLILSKRLEYLEKDKIVPIQFKIDEVGRIIRGLQKSLKAKLF